MRVLVFGGRDYKRKAKALRTLSEVHKETPITVIIEGGATGADYYAKIWAGLRNIAVEEYRADWDNMQAVIVVPRLNRFGDFYNAAAGNLRNVKMMRESHPDMAIEFPGGKGTADMHRLVQTEIKRRAAAGLPELRYLKVDE